MITATEEPPVDEPIDYKAEVEKLLPHYYGPRDKEVWWRRPHIKLDRGTRPEIYLEQGRGKELLAILRPYYHPEPPSRF